MKPEDIPAPSHTDTAEETTARQRERDRSGVFLGSFRGIRFYLDYSWFFIAALLIYALSAATFPFLLPGRDSSTYILMAGLATGLFFLSILLHELGHSLVSQRCGIPVPRITLLFIGGIAEISREPDDARSELKIAVAGPLVSLGLVCIFGVLGWVFGSFGHKAGQLIFWWLAQINLILVLFNAIPGYPLDGGRVLRALIWMKTGKLRQATYITSRIGLGFAIFLIAFGIYSLLAWGAWNGLVLIFIGLFLRSAAESGYSQTVYREILEGIDVKRIMSPHPITIPAHLPISLAVDDYFLTNHHVAFPVVDHENYFRGLVRLEFLKSVRKERWPYTLVSEIADRPECKALSINANEKASEALRILLTAGQGRLAVVDDEGHLVGMLTRHDLLHFIRIHTELRE